MRRKSEQRNPQETLRTLLLELNLTTVAQRLGELLAKVETSQPAYSEFLREVLEAEQAARWERKILRRTRCSKLGACLGLEAFDFAARPQLSAGVVKELLTCRFVEEKRNVILVGRPSTGKTTIARALGHATCQRGMSVYSGSLSDVLATLHASRADGTYRRTFRRLERPDLLVLDSCGVIGYVEWVQGNRTVMRLHGLPTPHNYDRRGGQRASSHSRMDASRCQAVRAASTTARGRALARAARFISRFTAA